MPFNQAEAIAALQASHGNLDNTLQILNNLNQGVTIPVNDLKATLDSMSTNVDGATSAIFYSGNLTVFLPSIFRYF